MIALAPLPGLAIQVDSIEVPMDARREYLIEPASTRHPAAPATWSN